MLYIVVLVIVVIIAALWYFFWRTPSGQVNEITEIAASDLPQGFPKDIPLQDKAEVIANYNAVTPDQKLQASRVFASAQSVDKNFAFYKTYLLDKKNGWTFLAELNADPEHKALFAKNSKGVVNINISKASEGSIVDISFLSSTPKQ